MKKKTAVFCSMLMIAGMVQAESGMFWEFAGGLWIAPDVEGYTVAGGFLIEEYDAGVAFNMDAKFGYQWDMDHAKADVAGMLGWYAGPVVGIDFGGDASYCFKVTESGGFTIGPHAGIKFFAAPTWIGDNDEYVEFDGTAGGLLGVKMTFGSRKVKGVLTADFIAAEFDAEPKNGGVISDSTLDMGGFIIQGGVQF